MRFNTMSETLDRAQKQYDQAKSRLQKLKNRENEKQRKQDTRNKILLGGWLLAQAKHERHSANEILKIIETFNERDKSGFQIYDFLKQEHSNHE